MASLLLATPVHAIDWGGVKDFFGWNNNTAEKQANTMKAIAEGEKGKANQETLVAKTEDIFGVATLLHVAGPSDSALAQLNEEDRQIILAKYGRGAIGDMGAAVAYLFTPAASSKTYVADVMKSAHMIPKAQAQGIGFASLDPILETWKIFRNIAYLFFVITFLIIGFMIMFRTKLSGQTVVTAQQAIPQIIIALVAVTFSYAIAGFLIDIMYLFMYLIIGLFGNTTELIDKNFMQLGMDLVTGSDGAFGTVNQAVQAFVGSIGANMGALGDVAAWVSGITVALIVAIAILIGVFKLFFELLKTYIKIITSIAFAPITLMMGAIPGNNTFVPWIKTIIANLAAFPTVLILLIMYKTITENSAADGGFLPPYMIGQGNGAAITTLAGIGIILVLSEAVKEVKKALGDKDGIITTLSNQAWGKNAWAGEPALPVAAGAIGAAGGGAQSLWHMRKEGIDPFSEAGKKIFREGYSTTRHGKTVTVGGTDKAGGNWMKRGQEIRKGIDRAREGRFFDAEDPTKLLRSLVDRGGDKDEKDTDNSPEHNP